MRARLPSLDYARSAYLLHKYTSCNDDAYRIQVYNLREGMRLNE